IPSARKKLLNGIGFVWRIRGGGINNESWESRFAELKEFKVEHNHCNVPTNQISGLGRWVQKQRAVNSNNALHPTGRKGSIRSVSYGIRLTMLGTEVLPNLKSSRRNTIIAMFLISTIEFFGSCVQEDVGFVWKPWDGAWSEKFAKLKEYKETHEHCDGPRSYSGGLGNWVYNQSIYNKRNTLNNKRKKLLEDIGFVWGI
ncbi:hypothetical protein HJC23_006760, partial [Cyclotella cryptica]